MARNRDPFRLALETLRRSVCEGAFHPERPIVIQDEAGRLGLSTTPVREALAWLSGQGLVQRAASGGYLGARLDPAGARSRYAFRLNCLRWCLEAASLLPGEHWGDRASREGGAYPAAAVFERIVQLSGDGALKEAFSRVDLQLAMLAAAEARLLDDLEAEANSIFQALSRRDIPGLMRALTAYHHRRIALAVPLLLEAESGGRTSTNDPT